MVYIKIFGKWYYTTELKAFNTTVYRNIEMLVDRETHHVFYPINPSRPGKQHPAIEMEIWMQKDIPEYNEKEILKKIKR